MKFACVPEPRFDKHDRHIAAQPMHAANLLLLFRDRMMPGPMRHKHWKFQVPQSIPQKTRCFIDEVKLFEP